LKLGEEQGMGWVLLLLLFETANGCLQLCGVWVLLLLLFLATPTEDEQRRLLLCCAFVD
jgi:hypothetical protein